MRRLIDMILHPIKTYILCNLTKKELSLLRESLIVGPYIYRTPENAHVFDSLLNKRVIAFSAEGHPDISKELGSPWVIYSAYYIEYWFRERVSDKRSYVKQSVKDSKND